MATIRIQAEPFDPGHEIAALLDGQTGIGGLGCFIGTVRDSAGGRPIRALTLEHYAGMTERALAGIAQSAETRWPLLGCTVIHRVGRLLPGAPIVLVLAASPHRQAALDATAYLIDWLKTEAPFWKSEELESGETLWVEARDSDTAATARWQDLSSPSPPPPPAGGGSCAG